MIVYSYGCKPPHVNVPLVEEQLSKAHAYHNKLVEITRAHRVVREEGLLAHAPYAAAVKAHADVLTLLVEARGELKALRSAVHKREVSGKKLGAEGAALLDRIKSLRESERTSRGAARDLRGEAKLVHVALLAAADEKAAADKRTARAACNLYWGTYLLVERAVDAAVKTPGGANFRRWTGDGYLGVQLQHGLPIRDLLAGTDTRAQFVEAPLLPRTVTKKDGRVVVLPARERPEEHRVLRFRVGSEGRAPVWAEVRVTAHRPLPQDAVVKWVQVVRTRTAGRDRWGVRFTLEAGASPSRVGLPMVALDLGWRRLPGVGVRVAYGVGTDGNSFQLVLPEEVVSGWKKACDLRSIRDKMLNEVLEVLCDFRRANVEMLPAWFRERTQHAHAWRSPARLAALARAWKGQRFEGDGAAFARVWEWQGGRGDRHLWTWEANQRRGVLARRDDLYAKFAALLCRRYGSVVVEDFDLTSPGIGRAPVAEKGTADLGSPHRVLGAPGRLRERIRTTAAREGVGVLTLPAANTTRRCHACGLVRAFPAAEELHHRCSGCGAEWDQDENAARNLLAAALREHPGGAPRPETARAPKSAWSRRKAAKAERVGAYAGGESGTARAVGLK